MLTPDWQNSISLYFVPSSGQQINVGLEGLTGPLDLRFGSAQRIRAHVAGTTQTGSENVR
jgi:hypothetical protein